MKCKCLYNTRTIKKKFEENYFLTSLREKEDFYNHLNMDDITGADYTLEKKVCKDFKIKDLGEYYGLHDQINILLSSDVFENFQNICLEIYKLDPARFLTAT